MNTQDEKIQKSEDGIITGANIAPKGHGSGCPCCTPEDDVLDDED
ncbi:MAG: hypothetical protein AB8B83_06095 [Bdellovibrionales bacterium]